MAAYRQDQGLTIDDAVAADAEAALAAGAQQMKVGCLMEALEFFCTAADAVPVRSRLGGEATLQRAICLDSMGRSAEAKALYQSVERHPAPGIAKKARHMLFGYKAMDHLKAHNMSYSVGSAYDSYFARLTGKWAVYVAPEGSDKTNGLDALVATAVMLAPILLVGAKIGGRLLAK
ncbi:hypothetical protein WJX81_005544 [Elliptochloris bilobata]|uniref:Uncharacterized protein n=1 Tax=Elliptochloris bilobata TaxID=381761 RepID=A0AAW1QDH6_9CHLO